MLTKPPQISRHAVQRAKERLGIGESTFFEWVAATYHEWFPVNAEFLLNKNVKVSSHDSWFYATPWSPSRGVAIVLSDDKCIRTVIDFEAESKVIMADQKPIKAVELERYVETQEVFDTVYEGFVGNALCRTFQRLMQDKALTPVTLLRKAVGSGRKLETGDFQFIKAYADGEIDLADLTSILTSKKNYRVMAFECAIEKKKREMESTTAA